MNKKVKSLLVAGLLAVGINGVKVDAFASEQLVSTITYPKFDESNKKIISLQGGDIIVEVTKTEEGYKFAPKWNSNKFKVTNIIAYFDDEDKNTSIHTESVFQTGGFEPVEGDSNIHKTKKDIDMKISANLIKVEVKFDTVYKDNNSDGISDFKDSNPVIPEKEEVKDEKPTGDASIMPILATGIGSVVGLYVLNKKEDEE